MAIIKNPIIVGKTEDLDTEITALETETNNLDVAIDELPPKSEVAYRIVTAELPNTTITLTLDGVEIGSKTTDATLGGKVYFDLTTIGEYTITATKDGTTLWTNTADVSEIGVYNVKSNKGGIGRPLDNYTFDELHTICQGGYFSTMFDLKDKKVYLDSSSIYNNYDFFVENIHEDNGKEQVDFRLVYYGTGSYNMNPRYGYIANAEATSWSVSYSNVGGYKYSAMQQRMMRVGDPVYSQATGILPDDYSGTLTTGIKFSEFYYTDQDGAVSPICTYNATNDTMVSDSGFEYQTSNLPKFVKGYFVSVGSLSQSQFETGYYYTYSSYVYTRATSYSSGTTYYGFYETLQTNGVFYNGLSQIQSFLTSGLVKSSAGGDSPASIYSINSYVNIPSVELITGANRDTVLWGNRNVTGTIKAISINSYNVAGEDAKSPCYNDFQMQALGSLWWTRSACAGSLSSFCCFNYFGSIANVNAGNTYGARVGFRFT